MRSSRVPFAMLLTSMLIAPVALAQDQPAPAAAPKQPWETACKADVEKLCQTEIKAKTDVRPCLAKHEAELSQECNQKFIRGYKVLELCKDDIEKLCKEAQAQGKLGPCFQQNADKLSEKCRSALVKGSKAAKKEEAAAAKEDDAAGKTEAAEKTAKKPSKKAKK